MYLRLGWVVGQVGLGFAISIIIFSNMITLATALSMSSIVTNIRIGTGGAYSIITKSLGLEAGGAIGIPLYLSQAISVAFYITGFSECWISVFKMHNPILVSLIAWMCILIVSYISAKLAFRLQYFIMALVLMSLFSIFLGGGNHFVAASLGGGLRLENFWVVFAVFFPAVTGVLAGASMSGELIDPKKSIPKGTLWAVGMTFIIYTSLAVWFSRNASAQELVENTSIVIELGKWKGLVVAGIMGATLSSAIAMFVGAPRTLVALGKHSIVPLSNSFARVNKKGEPTTSILLTSLLVLLTLLLGTLNKVASLLTMIFLITYGMINLSVFIEQSIGITSFRPTFRIPRIVSFIGSIGCLIVMFLINVKFSIMALSLVIAIYVLLLRREIKIHSPDVRSGLLIFLAEKFAKMAARLPYHPKIWKPNVLVPVEDMDLLFKVIPFIETIVAPEGRIHFFKVIERDFGDENQDLQTYSSYKDEIRERLNQVVSIMLEKDLYVETSVVEAANLTAGSVTIMQAVKDMFFPPNTLFCLMDTMTDEHYLTRIMSAASNEGLGIIAFRFHTEHQLGEGGIINLWIRQGSPNIDLAVLVALQIQKNWNGEFRLVQAVTEEKEVEEAYLYLDKLKKLIRVPQEVKTKVLVGHFRNVLKEVPPADVNIFGMPDKPDLSLVKEVFEAVQTSVLFLRDSEHESAIA